MSTTLVLEQPQKKRAELENESASLDQKIKEIQEDVRELEKEVEAKLEEKVKGQRLFFEQIESQKKDLEKKLEELRENRGSPPRSSEPMSEIVEKKEESSSKRIFCQYCGAENTADATFCEKCGNNISSPGSP